MTQTLRQRGTCEICAVTCVTLGRRKVQVSLPQRNRPKCKPQTGIKGCYEGIHGTMEQTKILRIYNGKKFGIITVFKSQTWFIYMDVTLEKSTQHWKMSHQQSQLSSQLSKCTRKRLSTISVTVATQMNAGFFLSTASSFIPTRKPDGITVYGNTEI